MSEGTRTDFGADAQVRAELPTKTRGKGRLLFWLFAIVVLFAAGAIGYFLYWEDFVRSLPWNQVESEVTPVVAKPAEIREVQSSSDEFRLRLEVLESEVRSLEEENDELRALIANQATSNFQSVTASSIDQRLAEVEYLLRVAQQELMLEIDLGRPQAALRSAERVLMGLQDAALDELRALLTSNIRLLGDLVIVDTSEIHARISELKRQVSDLPRITPEYVGNLNVSAEKSESNDSEERSLISRVGDFFGSVFVIRQHDTGTVRPVLSEMQDLLIEQRLALALDRAQSAILRKDVMLFAASLDECTAIVNEYIDQQHEATSKFRNELESLKAAVVAAGPKPDLKRIVQLVQSIRSSQDTAETTR